MPAILSVSVPAFPTTNVSDVAVVTISFPKSSFPCETVNPGAEFGLILTTNPSWSPPEDTWNAPGVMGKELDDGYPNPVYPATYAFPNASTAIPVPASFGVPPRKLEKTNEFASDCV